jgi:hypothetical protein
VVAAVWKLRLPPLRSPLHALGLLAALWFLVWFYASARTGGGNPIEVVAGVYLMPVGLFFLLWTHEQHYDTGFTTIFWLVQGGLHVAFLVGRRWLVFAIITALTVVSAQGCINFVSRIPPNLFM